MAEQENLEATQAAHTAFGRGDIPAVLQDLADNLKWISPGESPISGTFRGKAAVQEWFAKLNETLAFHVFEPHDFIVQGDKVVVLAHSETTVRSTREAGQRPGSCPQPPQWEARSFPEYSDTLAFARAAAQ